jgi:hypothetical protein
MPGIATQLANWKYSVYMVSYIGRSFFNESSKAAAELTFSYRRNEKMSTAKDVDTRAPTPGTRYDPTPGNVINGCYSGSWVVETSTLFN